MPNAYNPPKPAEVYILSNTANDDIPDEMRKLLHTDEKGRVLFFHNAPLNRPAHALAPDSQHLGHSLRYLADKKRNAGRAAANVDSAMQIGINEVISLDAKEHRTRDLTAIEVNLDEMEFILRGAFSHYDAETDSIKKSRGLEDWEDMMQPIREDRARKAAQRMDQAREALAARRAAMGAKAEHN